MTHAAPLELWNETISPDWIDYNGHMNVAYYTLVFDHAVDRLWEYLGLGRQYRDSAGGSTFAVEHHITYNQEVVEGDSVRCTSRLIGYDEKRIYHYHEMYHATDGYLAATAEFLSLHVDLTLRKVTPLPESVLTNLDDVLVSHQALPASENVGRVMKIPSLAT